MKSVIINLLMQAKVRRSRSSSVSTTTSTSSNISGRSKEESRDTFAEFFGSKSSGLGSERRSSSTCVENLEEAESSNNCIPSDPEVVSPLLSPDCGVTKLPRSSHLPVCIRRQTHHHGKVSGRT